MNRVFKDYSTKKEDQALTTAYIQHPYLRTKIQKTIGKKRRLQNCWRQGNHLTKETGISQCGLNRICGKNKTISFHNMKRNEHKEIRSESQMSFLSIQEPINEILSFSSDAVSSVQISDNT